MVAGRTTEARVVSALTKTSGSAAVSAAAGTFGQEDVGRTVTGTGVTAGTTVASVQSATAATLSANATATNTASATLGSALASSAGFLGWSPETSAEAATYTVAANNAGTATPDRLTDTATARTQRSRG